MRDGDQEGFEYEATILTPRLLLRAGREADRPAIARLAGGAVNVAGLGTAAGGCTPGGRALVIVEREGGAIVGLDDGSEGSTADDLLIQSELSSDRG